MKLFTYCIPIDDGAAPNPFWGTCTLAICKPKIRASVSKNDWVAGVGSKNVNGVNYEGRLVYAMRIDRVMTLEEYDEYCLDLLPGKIPDTKNIEYVRRVGDCIYDFRKHPEGFLRKSVHKEINRKTDINGLNVLLSNHFYYFGNNAIKIPRHLAPIIKQGQGHKSNFNDPYKQAFVDWIKNSGYSPNVLHGQPQIKIRFGKDGCGSASKRCNWSEKDLDEDNC